MRTLFLPALFIAIVACAFSTTFSALAKGPVDAIELNGPSLAASIEITEGDALLDFNPWGQQFLGERLASAPDVTGALTVTMQMTDEAGALQPVYEFTYFPGPAAGVIYLPGPGDAQHDLNKTTIMSQNDGKWFSASPGWEAFFASLVQIRPPVTGSAGLK